MRIENHILVANTEWELPDNLIRDIQAERMINSLINFTCDNIEDYDQVGWAECVGYLMPAFCRNVLRSDVTKIYLYCFKKYLENKKWEKMLPEIQTIELTKYEHQKLKEYKKWIFKNRGGKIKSIVIDALKEVFKK